MSLLDEERTDWKVVAIDVNDPFAWKVNGIEDVETHLPGLLRATNEWFRVHEIPDGKSEKAFAFSGECKNKRYCAFYVYVSSAWQSANPDRLLKIHT